MSRLGLTASVLLSLASLILGSLILGEHLGSFMMGMVVVSTAALPGIAVVGSLIAPGRRGRAS